MSIEPSLERPVILIVDDTPHNLKLMCDLLKGRYRLKVANAGEQALVVARSDPPPDLILLDVMIPAMDAYEVCRRLKQEPFTRDIPVIFLTAKTDTADEEMGLQLGAVDYITKPISPPIVLARVETHLRLKASADFLRDKAAVLEQQVAERTREIIAVQDATILALVSLAETRDLDTGNHIRRTQHYVRVLAEHLHNHPRFASTLTDAYITTLFKSAPLHDIGKVGIPDRILLKPGKFEPDELEIMKTHTVLGRETIEHAERELGIEVGFLRCAKEIAQNHHEKWNGSGYPNGIGGDEIPICARLMAVADVYDALISHRVYKEGMSHEAAAEIIVGGRGGHFDPDVVAAFQATSPQLQAIALRYGDSDSDIQNKRETVEQLLGTKLPTA